MKVVILAGGLGTRLAEETEVKPKPMVEVGGQPILWHIMKHYAHHGFKEFVIALGYKGEWIKRYFLDYARLNDSFTLQLASGEVMRRSACREDWTIHLIDTGLHAQTGGRIKALAPLLRGETFLMTYGDGVSNLDLAALVEFHRRHGKLATVTGVHPPARFGSLVFDEAKAGRICKFAEKLQVAEGWINGGYFVLEPKVLDYIDAEETKWEAEPLERLAAEGQLMGYRHDDFWLCMDTLRDVRLLEGLWNGGNPPWKVWN
jgi:glucose-1-phosphate cytidylyltransferase